jgi:hypothetical protein
MYLDMTMNRQELYLILKEEIATSQLRASRNDESEEIATSQLRASRNDESEEIATVSGR